MTSMAEVLGAEVSRERLRERMFFHFREIFKRDWEEKDLQELMGDGEVKWTTQSEAAHTKLQQPNSK